MSKPSITLIAAIGRNSVIGYQGGLPSWSMKDDLRHFREYTEGKCLLMGRGTLESLRRTLPDRFNMVLTSKPREVRRRYPDAFCVRSVGEALCLADDMDEIAVIGGQSVYERLLPQADKLVLTLIHGEFDGDRFFPDWQALDWSLDKESIIRKDRNNSHNADILHLTRIRG